VFQHRRVPFTYFFLLFAFFLYRVFLPFTIFGRILRTLSTSPSVHAYTRRRPILAVFGAGTFLVATYRARVARLNPSFLAASRVDKAFILRTASQIARRKVKHLLLGMKFSTLLVLERGLFRSSCQNLQNPLAQCSARVARSSIAEPQKSRATQACFGFLNKSYPECRIA
jgi:hypothetical protein